MQVCSQCSRVNPPEASYCYHDGALLAGHAGSGPINPGAQAFPHHFVFPSGEICRNFDQLAMTCQQHWKAAVDLLKQGFLGTFFGGLGRSDLALAAQEAARFPDEDRGLDQLLAKLPTNVVEPPTLKAEPSEINLGQVPMGRDQSTEIHLSNLGMRLLYGSVVSDSKWLTVGEGQGTSQKLFQFGADTVVPIHIHGKDLRAGTKPLEGRLTVESNGGAQVVTIKADVPITPFGEGVLAGALTPRQIADKAKANPKEAAPLFEEGSVAQWFAHNGWTYPVQGPNVQGKAAVQQFFEALGLAKGPKVEVRTKSITLKGDAGQALQAKIEVAQIRGPDERDKFVVAYALCDQPWVDVSKVHLPGKTATITVAVPSVPNRPGETLQASLTVIGNGNQRFKVPLTLEVGAGNPFADLAPMASFLPPLPVPEAAPPPPFPAPAAPLLLTPAAQVPVLSQSITPAPPAMVMPVPNQAVAVGPPPLPTVAGLVRADDDALRAPRRFPVAFHLIPLGVLALVLLAFLIRDLVATPDGEGGDVDPIPRLAVFFDWKADVKDKKETDVGESLNWGLVSRENPKAESKRLIFNPRGIHNQTMIIIDGQTRILGNYAHGKWQDKPKNIGKWGGKIATWIFAEQIAVTQEVRIIPGEAIETEPNVYRRLIDTCWVRYRIENRDQRQLHRVGLRLLLDTYIGNNDGVPFTLPGVPGMVSTFKDFAMPQEVPDFIQALENPDLKEPGTIVQLNLRPDVKKFEPPGRVSLTRWPGHDFLRKPRWDVPVENVGEDSAIVLYWQPQDLPPGKSRAKDLAFMYGLGSVSVKGGRLGLTANGNTVVGGELTVVALVADPQPGQTATLELHPTLKLLPEFQATQPVPAAQRSPDGKVRPSPVTWRIRSTEVSPRDGGFPITVNTSDGLSQTRVIRIKSSSIF